MIEKINPRPPRVLAIGGSDSGAGAGIQADLKTITALGGYATTVITAVTAQNTHGVFAVHPVPEDFIRQQMKLVLGDIGADAIKTGMLYDAGVIRAVAETLNDYPDIPLIIDPVMVAKGGTALLQEEALKSLTTLLFPRACLITPNVPEAELLVKRDDQMTRLSDDPIRTLTDMKRAAQALLAFGSHAVLIKGGHLEGNTVTDILTERIIGSSDHRIIEFSSPRLSTPHTHGTGCTLASAIATGIAQGLALEKAVGRAHAYVQSAIRNAPGLGSGHGPLGVGHVQQ